MHCWKLREKAFSVVLTSNNIHRVFSIPMSQAFAETWITYGARNPILRNVDDLYIPAHRVEFVKRLPLFSFPAVWNSAPGEKLNPPQHLYLKNKNKNICYHLFNVLSVIQLISYPSAPPPCPPTSHRLSIITS
jgi:hypothetical protein